jgi:hypothetical protein
MLERAKALMSSWSMRMKETQQFHELLSFFQIASDARQPKLPSWSFMLAKTQSVQPCKMQYLRKGLRKRQIPDEKQYLHSLAHNALFR